MYKKKEFFQEYNYFKKNIVPTINYCLNKYGYNYVDENVKNKVGQFILTDVYGFGWFYYDVWGLRINYCKKFIKTSIETNTLIGLSIKFHNDEKYGYIYSVNPEIGYFSPSFFKATTITGFKYCYGYKIYSLDDMKIYLEMQFEDMEVLTKDEAMIKDIIE
jgi:hypothetical protein